MQSNRMSHYMYMHSDKHMCSDNQRTSSMNTSDTQNPEGAPAPARPFAYWLKAADRLLAAEHESALRRAGLTRRDARLLNTVAGTAASPHPLDERRMRHLIARGWAATTPEGWTLTDEGRAAKDRLDPIAEELRARIAEAVSPEDLDTTLASLERIAIALGWEEGAPLPRRHRSDRGRGSREHRGHGDHHEHRGRRPFGRGEGFGPRGEDDHRGRHEGFGPGFGPHRGPRFASEDRISADPACHGHEHGTGRDRSAGRGHGRRDHGAHRVAHLAQRAYERGFDAGYGRGRDS